MAALYANQGLFDLFSDITLVVGPREYRLHKIILSATSEIFREMCQYGVDTNEPIRLDETEDCAIFFEEFVKYLYTTQITLNLGNVDAIFTLADKYRVDDLKLIARQFQKKHESGTYYKN